MMTDIPIPPWLDLSEITVPVAKNSDGIITIGAKITLGEHYVEYIAGPSTGR